MTSELKTTEPDSFIVGDTVKWKIYLPDYLPADGWVLSYALVMSGNQQAITAADNGDGTHLVTITAASSAGYKTGIYHWQAYVTKSGERYRVRDGSIETKPDFASLTNGYDARGHIEKVLEALKATIEGKASKDQSAYTIGNRSISRLSPEELIKWKKHYEQLYKQEVTASKIAKGEVPGNRVMVRFNNG